MEWADNFAVIDTLNHWHMHNDNLKRKWIIKRCCERDIRHK